MAIPIITLPTSSIQNITIHGRVVDARTKEPLSGVYIHMLENDSNLLGFDKTDSDGMYTLKTEYDVVKLVKEKPSIKINYIPSKEFSQKSYIPLTAEHYFKNDLPPIELEHTKSVVEELLIDVSKTPQKSLSKIKDNLKVDFNWIKSFFNNAVQNINKNMLPPLALMLAEFGISKIGQKKQHCPKKEDLLKIIQRRNKLVKGLNNLYKALDILVKANTAVKSLIKLFKLVSKVLINLPTPIIEYMPESKIHKMESTIQKIIKIVEKYDGLTNSILIHLIILRDLIKRVIDKLKELDINLQQCYIEQSVDPDNPLGFESYLEPLNIELQELNEDDKSKDDIKTYHNGFELKVVNVEKNPIHGFYRKQAVAINPQGIIVLKGEPSFSSSDQILINEIIFYINVNELKAD